MLKHGKAVIAGLSIAAATATAFSITAAGASTAAPRHSSATTLKLLVHGGSLTPVNVTGAKAFPRTGDELILVEPVYATARPKRVIGHAYITATFVTPVISPPAGLRDEVTLVLQRGAIELAGVTTANPSTLAVTGGTGIYRDARGQASVTTRRGKGNPASITLRLS